MEKILMLVDESYEQDFCSVCVVCIQGERRIEAVRKRVLKMKLQPSIVTTTTEGIRHYTEDSIGVRQATAPIIGLMPISAYICLSQTNVPTDKKTQDEYVYSALLPKIVKSLLQKYQYTHNSEYDVHIEFENLSNRNGKDLAFFENHLAHLRTEFKFGCLVVGKEEEPLLFLPDYFLGFTRDLILKKRQAQQKSKSGIKPETWPAQLFNLIVNKVGVILSVENGNIQRFGRGDGVRKFLVEHTN